jgi:hypothetical protein
VTPNNLENNAYQVGQAADKGDFINLTEMGMDPRGGISVILLYTAASAVWPTWKTRDRLVL